MSDIENAYHELMSDPAGAPKSEHYVKRLGHNEIMIRWKNKLQLSRTPLRLLLSGQIGVGKTTETHRLAQLLDHRCALVIADKDVLAHEGMVGIAIGLAESYQIGDLAGQTDLGRHLGYLRERLQAEKQRGGRARVDLDPAAGAVDLEQGRDAVRLVLERIRSEAGELPVALVDLEQTSKERAELIAGSLVDMPGHFVVIVHTSLFLSPDRVPALKQAAGWELDLLPAISIRDRQGKSIEDGWQFLRELVTRRAGDAIMVSALDHLVEASGGIPRDLLTLAGEACIYAIQAGLEQVGRAEAELAVADRRYQMSLRAVPEPSSLAKALEIRETKKLPMGALDLIGENLIVAYRDQSSWYDVHPLFNSFLPDPQVAGGSHAE